MLFNYDLKGTVWNLGETAGGEVGVRELRIEPWRRCFDGMLQKNPGCVEIAWTFLEWKEWPLLLVDVFGKASRVKGYRIYFLLWRFIKSQLLERKCVGMSWERIHVVERGESLARNLFTYMLAIEILLVGVFGKATWVTGYRIYFLIYSEDLLNHNC
jgi:hypothetical protein